MFSDRSRLLADDLTVQTAANDSEIAALKWSAAPESARRKARERAAHIREILTGYRSGNPLTALPHRMTEHEPVRRAKAAPWVAVQSLGGVLSAGAPVSSSGGRLIPNMRICSASSE